jgi:hypothetical protein
MMELVSRQKTLQNEIYKQKRQLPQLAYGCGKPLNQAVSASLPTGNSARTAYLYCIKLGTIIDPACGSGSLLIRAAEAAPVDVAIYGQEKEITTAGLARMNLVLHNRATAEIKGGYSTFSDPQFKMNNQLSLPTSTASAPRPMALSPKSSARPRLCGSIRNH